MSDPFEVPVVRVDEVLHHENADRLEVARIGRYMLVVGKGQWRAGDKAVYLPESALVPEEILRSLNLWDESKGKGKLAGPEGNRVKAVRLRGQLSQGLLWKPSNIDSLAVGYNAASDFGIEKHEPQIPENMSGQVTNVGADLTVSYDIDSWQRYPDAIPDGTPVVITEKIHGTFACFAYLPFLRNDDLPNGNVLVYSKGLGAKGLVFKDTEENSRNVYLNAWKRVFMDDTRWWDSIVTSADRDGVAVHVMGEIFGPGIQDLQYGLKRKDFRVFDVMQFPCDENGYVDGRGKYLDWHDLESYMSVGVRLVPKLYGGPFSEEVLLRYRDGKEMVSGSDQIREGVVVVPSREMEDARLHGNRVKLKATSPDYLMRKGGTEFN